MIRKNDQNRPVLVFDFDGTIADTHRYIIEISNRLADEFQYRKILPAEIEDLKNKTAKEIIGVLRVPMLKIPAIIARAKKEFYEGIAQVKPIAGVREVLAELKQNGAHMGILSSNNQENIRAFLEIHGLTDIFDFIHTTSKVWSKNTSLKDLAGKYDLTLGNILYVGDETRDITAARKVNAKVIAVAWGYNSAKVLKKHRPDYLLQRPEELLQFA